MDPMYSNLGVKKRSAPLSEDLDESNDPYGLESISSPGSNLNECIDDFTVEQFLSMENPMPEQDLQAQFQAQLFAQQQAMLNQMNQQMNQQMFQNFGFGADRSPADSSPNNVTMLPSSPQVNIGIRSVSPIQTNPANLSKSAFSHRLGNEVPIPSLDNYAVQTGAPIQLMQNQPALRTVKSEPFATTSDSLAQRFGRNPQPMSPSSGDESTEKQKHKQRVAAAVVNIPPEIKGPAPTIKVLDTEFYPYPKFWIKTYHLRPSVICLIENYTFNVNNLVILAVPVDPETRQPLSNARLESAAEVINEDLTNELQPRYGMPAVRFSDMKIIGDRTLSSKQGNDILLGFVVFSKHKFPPVPLAMTVHPSKIRVYNRFNELPAPNIVKMIPNVIMCNQTQEVTVYGQLFKKGKGVTCGITNLGLNQNLTSNSLNDMIPPWKVPPPQVVKVTSEYSTFSFPLCSPYEGYTLINASNDQARYGLGKLIYFQKEPTYQPNSQYSGFSGDMNRPGNNPNDPNFRGGPGTGGPGSGGPSGNNTGGPMGHMGMDGAAYSGNLFHLQKLVAEGVSINETDKYGNSPLYWSCWSGHVEITAFLLRNGADVNIHNRDTRETPLHVAARNGHDIVIKMLLKFGANPNSPNSSGCLPLHLAAGEGHLEIVELLSRIVENPNYADKDSCTALHYAIIKGHTKVAKYLVKMLAHNSLSLNKSDELGFSPLHWAATVHNEVVAKVLVEHGADVNKLDFQSESCLFIAVRNSDESLVTLFLENGGKTDIKNIENQMAIHYAQTFRIKGLLMQYESKRKFNSNNPVVVVQAADTDSTLETLPTNSAVAMVTHSSVADNDQIAKLKAENYKLMKAVQDLTRKLKGTVLEEQTVRVQAQQVFKPIPQKADYATDEQSKDETETVDEDEEEEEEEEEEEMLTYTVKIHGTDSTLGEIKLQPGSTLTDARAVMDNERKFPRNFTFFFSRMQSFVEEHQETKLKAEACGSTLLIKPIVATETPERAASFPAQQSSKKQVTQTSEERENSENVLGGDDDETDVTRLAADFWKSQFAEDSVVSTDSFVESLVKSSPLRSATPLQTEIVQSGLKDFFGTLGEKRNGVILKDLILFLKTYGPIERSQQRVLNVYSEPYFHGFITFEDSKKLLKGQYGGFLIRYSQSLIHKGCFVLNVNKGREQDSIENYVIRYHPQFEKFIFYNKPYDTLQNFVEDPIYANILKVPVPNANKFYTPVEVEDAAGYLT